MTLEEFAVLREETEWIDGVTGLVEVLHKVAAATNKGEHSVAVIYDDMEADYGPLMDGLMTLGFSRTWTFDEKRNQGTLEVRWS